MRILSLLELSVDMSIVRPHIFAMLWQLNCRCKMHTDGACPINGCITVIVQSVDEVDRSRLAPQVEEEEVILLEPIGPGVQNLEPDKLDGRTTPSFPLCKYLL